MSYVDLAGTMASSILKPRQAIRVPAAGQVVSVILSLVATTILTLFLTQRLAAIKTWSRIPFTVWLVLAIYVDSYLFVFASALLEHAFGVNSSIHACEGAILLCLVCYVTTKLIYLFLVEKAHIIRGSRKKRLQSRLYLFNSFGMLGVYLVVVVLNFIFRIAIMKDGQCIIGMKSLAMIPLISFDAVINTYLTLIFLIPLKKLYTFKNMPRTRANIRLRTAAFRTFCGAVCTLLSSIVNLSVLVALDGEPAWICLVCCNSDIMFSSAVIQWVTSKDNAGTTSETSSRGSGALRKPTNEPSPVPSFEAGIMHHSQPLGSADVSLVATARSSGCVDEDETFSSAARITNLDSVIVTTTIKHESRPCDQGFDAMPTVVVEASGGERPSCKQRGDGRLGKFLSQELDIAKGASQQDQEQYHILRL